MSEINTSKKHPKNIQMLSFLLGYASLFEEKNASFPGPAAVGHLHNLLLLSPLHLENQRERGLVPAGYKAPPCHRKSTIISRYFQTSTNDIH